MTSPADPGRMLFVNIPVADLERSKAFFASLGFGIEADPADDHGFMYSRSFFDLDLDLDGHGWQVMWMDPAAVAKGPAAFAESRQEAHAPA